jgi:hypothetical protein
VVVDPTTGRILRRVRVPGFPQVGSKSIYRTRRGLVVLLQEAEAGGEAQRVFLAVVGADGTVRTVALPGIWAGVVSRNGQSASQIPDFVVDTSGAHAFVFGLNEATVILLTDFQVERRLLPAAAAITDAFAAVRRAVPIRDGLVAMTGRGFTAAGDRPAGLVFLSTDTWSALRIDDDATGVARAESRVLAYGGRTGLRGYGLDGSRAFSLLPSDLVATVDVTGPTAYARIRSGTVIIDADGGTVSRRLTSGPVIIEVIGCG